MGALLFLWAIFIFAAWMSWQNDGWIFLVAGAFFTVFWYMRQGGRLKWLAAIARIFRFFG